MQKETRKLMSFFWLLGVLSSSEISVFKFIHT